jgi:Ca-activated chloride channel family protein
MQRSFFTMVASAVVLAVGCRPPPAALVLTQGDTFAEMHTVKGDVTVTPPGEASRAPYPRERISDGEGVTLAAGALAWIRRDGGAVWLVEGPATLTLKSGSTSLEKGRAFVDSEGGPPVEIESPRGPIELADARASVEVRADGTEEVYVLRGSARAGSSGRAETGELLTLKTDGKATRGAAVAWEDWTGGLATADPAAEPAPFGIGTVGARLPGDKGKPRVSLAIERLDVRVTVDGDFATTEVDQTFVNPRHDAVEGIFSFRTPPGAVLQKFGVDRDGDLVWGQIKESAQAQAQYESNVYAGSTEDPALLQWVTTGVYNARLYPIPGGAKRRVVTRYAEWLPRQGPNAERRLYVYPMAAEGARASLPRIEELHVDLDLSQARADRVRAGMGGKRDGQHVVMQAFDFVPRADLAVELFDGGQNGLVAYRAPHVLSAEDVPVNAGAGFAAKVAAEEKDYLLIPVRSPAPEGETKGVDLAIVVDTSAATDAGSLAIARSLAAALLAHLGPEDRAALWAGDATLRPVADGSGQLTAIDAERRRAWLAALAGVEPGGATDIGALLTEAAGKLEAKRRGAVVYIGDGQPSVGELAPTVLHERLARLPQGARVLAAGVGARANFALLASAARGAPVEPVSDAYSAARSALRLLEAAQRSAWLGASVDLGPGVERVLPRELPPVGVDEEVLVVGRISGVPPTSLTLTGSGGSATLPMRTVPIRDSGDLRRRWGQGRLDELLAEGSGRAALVDVATRFGLVSPYTSLYVPTKRETARAGESPETLARERAEAVDRRAWWRPWSHPKRSSFAAVAGNADDKEGGTGTRAKGEEGSMGNPHAYAVAASAAPSPVAAAAPAAPAAKAAAPRPTETRAQQEASQFGMIGLLGDNRPAGEPPPASAPPPAPTAAAGGMWGDSVKDSFGSGGLGLDGVGEGGGGRGEGIGVGGVGTIGHGAGMGTGQGFGNGHGRLGGAHQTSSPSVRQGATVVNGRLPAEVIQRIVRQNFGRFRLCYENGLRTNPNLAGRVSVKFVIDKSGSVATTSDGGSDIPDQGVVGCVVRGFGNLSFPQPESGIVTVTYPIIFNPGDGAPPPATPAPVAAAPTPPPPKPEPPKPPPPTALAVIGHAARPCGLAAELSLDERRILWTERLSVTVTATDTLVVYHQALEACEAPTWRERYALLLGMVDHLRSVSERVGLWKALIGTPAADVVYRAILVRVQTMAQLRELHEALGLPTVDPELLAGMLAKAKTPADRVTLLRTAAAKWPDDLELALRVLDAYEDAGDENAGRAWARRLRRRADATAHVWTSVGEYYLRLGAREKGAAGERDTTEGRRTFGELVEFAPDDPAARRRLGDLLRAHGWYEEAFRQYETLAQLTPDDLAVPMLLAAAAQGMGRVEEAVAWAEKAAAGGAPDGASGLSRSAEATASAFLAWARLEALRTGRTADADKLLARARRLASATVAGQENTVRFLVTWAHPELHPSLWTTALGAPMPAPDNFPLYGVAEARLPVGSPVIELHLDPDDAARAARLGATAVVTAIIGEGTASERIARLDVGFGSVAKPSDRVGVKLDGETLRVVETP